MPSLADDDDDRDLIGSQDGSSDNEDEQMRDADDGDVENDNDPDQELDQEQEQDAESPSNNSQTSDGPGNDAQQDTDPNILVDSLDAYRPTVRPECLTATTYDIVPTIAAPQSTSINAVTSTGDMRWVFSGGSDGYIRKYNWVESVNGKLMLTVAQRHPFVDSVVKAGVLMNYWENMDGNVLSPVYSLAAQNEGLWLLSGLESGNIRLQTVRHEEGREIALLKSHTSAVSVLNLSPDERSLLSGSWDKRVLDWDLNIGQVRTAFGISSGQISAIEVRPDSALPIPQDTMEPQYEKSFSSNNHLPSSTLVNGAAGRGGAGQDDDAPPASPADSLFGGADSLFGDGDNHMADDGEGSGDAANVGENALFGGSLDMDIRPSEHEVKLESENVHQPNGTDDWPSLNAESSTVQNATSPKGGDGTKNNGQIEQKSDSTVNGLPYAEALESINVEDSESSPRITSDTTFLASSIDGPIRIWDRRQPDPVARITPRNVPPWCMNACWSPDGNYIYAGRRNGTVEEYSLHKGLRDPERVFKLPQVGGAVTALKAMPNGRHLLCASHDILRLYDLKGQPHKHSPVPFLVIPGHRTGVISQLYIDSACRFLISASGNRGWEGNTTEVLLGYEINV
ncbi:transcription factor (SPT8), putative [Talaromyces stipitatus ATCC 10500]|uniref:Transcription factor (SPT8), putative n=1 Tax=Talaromyces stipitatus (strain ATCC 10500 / CBS 375.48 / QM 6759 / NRRL 1006) TaxID=441959 RepID=B8MD52_TALSN|nr:transcription factor (SPT8), putative [Talaromyces stipitatus ATCC 10500]EED17577.1 transcription factor (SPT8), putative [Talaromyces stipitatus ATCC 10500]